MEFLDLFLHRSSTKLPTRPFLGQAAALSPVQAGIRNPVDCFLALPLNWAAYRKRKRMQRQISCLVEDVVRFHSLSWGSKTYGLFKLLDPTNGSWVWRDILDPVRTLGSSPRQQIWLKEVRGTFCRSLNPQSREFLRAKFILPGYKLDIT